jgi:UDP-glucose:(heptosyl)LPS alpha-1,3-glucosyltransferase
MRIAVTIERLDVRRGGAEVATARLIEQLVRRGHEVHLLAREIRHDDIPTGVHTHMFPIRRPTIALRVLGFADAVARHLAQSDYDLSLASGPGLAEDVVWAHKGAHAAAVAGEVRKYYFSVWLQWLRGYQDFYSAKDWVYRHLELRRFASQSPPHVIAMSKMVAADFQRYYGVQRDRTRLVYHQVDLKRFRPERMQSLRGPARAALAVDDNSLVILWVGHNFKRKGARPLVEAAAQLLRRRRDFRVIAAGSTVQRSASYQRLAQRLGCDQCVRFIGQHSQIETLYAAADVFCLPTFYDPFGLVVLEAMACGLPVIVSRYAGVAELVRHGVDGFILQEPRDVAELATVLGTLFDPAVRKRVGAAAIESVHRLRQETPTPDIVAVLEELAGVTEPRKEPVRV